MIGSESLLRETLRRGLLTEPYNHEIVARSIAHVCRVYSEASHEQDSKKGSGLFESLDNFLFIALKKSIERDIRILICYHYSRFQRLAYATSIRDDSARQNITNCEVDFAEAYGQLIGELAAQISDFIDFSVDSTPPDDLLIAVRVIKDCGFIQTEDCVLHLNPNTLHFVRKRDVQHLLDQGFLIRS